MEEKKDTGFSTGLLYGKLWPRVAHTMISVCQRDLSTRKMGETDKISRCVNPGHSRRSTSISSDKPTLNKPINNHSALLSYLNSEQIGIDVHVKYVLNKLSEHQQ